LAQINQLLDLLIIVWPGTRDAFGRLRHPCRVVALGRSHQPPGAAEMGCSMSKRLFLVSLAIAVAALLAPLRAEAGPVISVGTSTTTVPGSLFDPLSSLTSPLPTGQFLLPIDITGASALQDWSFDLNFTDGVVTPADDGGLYQSVYQAEFNAPSDTTLSNITASGLLVSGSPLDTLQGIAGFSSGVRGNGLLAYVLFDRLTEGSPGFSVSNATISQTPEPGTATLLAGGLALLGSRRLLRRN
jgi:hypothetical protein